MTVKQADPLADPNNRMMAERIRNMIVGLGGGGLGIGAAVAGVQGLNGLVANTTGDPPKVPLRRQFVDIPIARRKPREENTPLRTLAKAAAALTKAAETPFMPPPSPSVSLVSKGLEAAGAYNPANAGFWRPSAKSVWNTPWGPSAALGLGTAGLWAGHSAAKSLIGKATDHEDDVELEEAKKRYEKSLSGKVASGLKEAANDPYAGLDRVWDLLEKSASMLWDDVGMVSGAAAAGLGTVALGTGKLTYDYLRNRSHDKAIETAMRQRREQLFANNPPAIVAIPREVDEPDDKKPGIDIRGLRDRLSASRFPKSAELSPSAAGHAVMNKLNVANEAVRQKAMLALGLAKEEKPQPPAEPTPYRPPSVIGAPAAPAK